MSNINIYLPSGYVNVPLILKPKIFHTVIMIGGRGTGKSYGVLDHVTGSGDKFFYMRTQQTELDLMSDPELNPFNSLNVNNKTDYTLKKRGKYVTGIYPTKEDSNGNTNLMGLCTALSTIYHVRGMDAQEYKYLFYDEIISEPHVRSIKEQYKAIKGAYETLNRNRELDGKPPLRLIMCGNSDDINNDILAGYNLIDVLFKMREKGEELKDFPERGLRVVYTLKSPISARKKKTALYKGQDNDTYTQMSLGNEFTQFYHGNIKTMNLKQFEPVLKVGDIAVYKSKGEQRVIYVTPCINDTFPYEYGLTDYELMQFRYRHKLLLDLYLRGKLIFENASCEIAFYNLWKK